MKLRTKFLLASLVVSAGLTTTCLLLVRNILGRQARTAVTKDLKSSVVTFENVRRQHEKGLARSARLVANLPIVRALMTTEDASTIQDASENLRALAEADLLVLSDATAKVMALHTSASGFSDPMAEEQLHRSIRSDERTYWWFGAGHLWQVSIQPIFFGAASQGHLLGYVALGNEVDDNLVRELSQVAESEVIFLYRQQIVRSTLPKDQWPALARQTIGGGGSELDLSGDHYLAQSERLSNQSEEPVTLVVLKSLDQATSALRNLNRLLMLTGIIALVSGAILVFFISHTFTRPLRDLVDGVRALGRGDYRFPLQQGGHDEVAELTRAFQHMRTDLQGTQRELLESEKLATIGRMASSISHDLRHHLVAIMANTEFLIDARRGEVEREELYHEVKLGVLEMNELIESLLEFSRTRESLHRSPCRLQDVVERAVQTAKMHPDYQRIPVEIDVVGKCEGDFDGKKLERAFQNLLVNSFAATAPGQSPVVIKLVQSDGNVAIRISDQGKGIPADIRDKIFEPFFSSGKENGTGLGLNVVQKIVQDHLGEIQLESSSDKGTVFRITLPVVSGSAPN
jgi:signal transduction histidine kinase